MDISKQLAEDAKKIHKTSKKYIRPKNISTLCQKTQSRLFSQNFVPVEIQNGHLNLKKLIKNCKVPENPRWGDTMISLLRLHT